MNVYEINDVVIAAKDADSAFSGYMEHMEGLVDTFYCGDLAEGEEFDMSILIKRLTQKEIVAKQIPCCSIWGDGCELCEGKNDEVYVSYQDLIDKRKETDFPCVIAKEE